MIVKSLRTFVSSSKALAMQWCVLEQGGFDIVIECSGFPPALQQALAWTKRGATIMIFGCAPPGKAVNICPEDVFRKVGDD